MSAIDDNSSPSSNPEPSQSSRPHSNRPHIPYLPTLDLEESALILSNPPNVSQEQEIDYEALRNEHRYVANMIS